MPRKTGAEPAPAPADALPEEEGDKTPAPMEDDHAPAEEPAPLADEETELHGLDDTPEEEETIRALWWGVQGTTKTTSLARILLARPVGKLIVCNAEAGLKTKPLRQWGVDTSRIVVWPKPGVRPTFDGLERLAMKVDQEMAAARAAGEPKPYCAFGIDSITELVKLMLDNLSEDALSGQREIDRRLRESGERPPSRRINRSRFKAERDDYQIVSGQMRSILRRLCYMELDFLVTALVRRDEDQDSGKTTYGPAAPPALQQDLLGYVDVAIRIERRASEDGKHEEIVGHTVPDENNVAKDRYGALPAELHDPGADRVLAYVLGETTREASESAGEDAEGSDEAPETETTEPDTNGNGYEISPETEEALQAVEKEQAAKPARTRRSRAKTTSGAAKGRTISASVGPNDGSDENPPF